MTLFGGSCEPASLVSGSHDVLLMLSGAADQGYADNSRALEIFGTRANCR